MPSKHGLFDIFLSYSRSDLERARTLFELLGRQGWTVFMDEKMPNATRWRDYILHHLETTTCTLVLWSENARDFEWVNLEAHSALNRGKLVHARLDAHLPPDGFSEYQAADLSHWNGNIRDPEWLNVLAAVACHIGSKGAVGTLESAKPYEMLSPVENGGASRGKTRVKMAARGIEGLSGLAPGEPGNGIG